MKKHRFFLALGTILPTLLILWAFTLQDKDHPVLQNIIGKFESYFKRLPQQKVYLHFDKSSYKADETVWFKAYIVDACNHKPDNSTSNLYIDLINPSGYIVQSKLLRMTNGFGNGDFSFLDTIPEGIYKIRAFTNWMQNTDPDFFFEKDIYIANPDFSTYVTRDELHTIKKEARKNKRSKEHFDIQFLPEGGHLLSGVENRIGFKALNKMGHGTKVKGEIVDSRGLSIAKFESSELGMGSIRITPKPDEKYTALVNIGEEKPIKVKIPAAIDRGVIISAVKTNDEKISIKLLSNFRVGELPPNTAYFLLAHIRGKVCLSHEFDLVNKNDSIEVPAGKYPSGIMHFTLFNIYSQPVSERLIFVNNHDELNINLSPQKEIVSTREKISLRIKVSDKNNHPSTGSFSLSVANSDDVKPGDNILSNLLLNSDIKGKIENPQYYFSDWNEKKEAELDDLMLTQGWNRFNWTNVLSDFAIPPKYENEKGISISGKITREFFNIPLRDIKVTLSILNEFNDVFSTRSGEFGFFRFDDLDYSDTVSVSIEAHRANGKHNLVIYVDGKSDEKLKNMRYVTNQNLKHRGEKGGYKEPPNPDADDPYAKENNRIYRLHEEPSKSNVIIVDEKMQNYQSIAQIIEGRVAGVTVTGNKVNIRGISSLYGNTDPLFLVDGIQVDPEYALSMNPYDVERIEVLKGPETAIYGSRGANGVIAIYTKRGKFMKKGVLDFKMLGYVTPKEYYEPGLEYRSDDPFADDRRTILWTSSVTSNSEGEASVSFYTSDLKGTYYIQIEGISSDGIPGVGISEIEVR
jgi:TonB-dependent SusC/RagA subfamily outer membrane receptor